MAAKVKIMHDEDLEIARNLTSTLDLTAISRKELCKQLGLTVSQLNRYERAEQRMYAGTLLRISKLTMRPIRYFFDKDGIV